MTEKQANELLKALRVIAVSIGMLAGTALASAQALQSINRTLKAMDVRSYHSKP